MENPEKTNPKSDNKEVEKSPLVIPKEMPERPKSEQEISVPHKPEIERPSEDEDNWDEKLPKQGYDPNYPDMPTSSGTLL